MSDDGPITAQVRQRLARMSWPEIEALAASLMRFDGVIGSMLRRSPGLDWAPFPAVLVMEKYARALVVAGVLAWWHVITAAQIERRRHERAVTVGRAAA